MELTPRPQVNVYIGGFLLNQRFDLVDGRHRWTNAPGILVGAFGIVAAAFTFALQPWSAGANIAAWLPMVVATTLLLFASDQMMRPKPPWSRFRDSGVVLSGWIALTMILVISVMTEQLLAWPLLYPLFVFPMALPAFALLGLAPTSRLDLSLATWRRITTISLVLAIICLAIAALPYQHQIASEWTR